MEKPCFQILKIPETMLILASKSETRKTLLRSVGIAFDTRTARVDERAIEEELAANGADKSMIALQLAREKALAVSMLNTDAVVIGADQTLSCGSLDLHKPDSRETAAGQLRMLAGQTHTLHAAAALAHNGTILWDVCDEASLTMRDFSAAELEHVLDLEGDAVLSSVGGYRLEGPSVRLFARVEGDYFTILGLPLLAVLDGLRRYVPQFLEP